MSCYPKEFFLSGFALAIFIFILITMFESVIVEWLGKFIIKMRGFS
jgi:hypothetical protein